MSLSGLQIFKLLPGGKKEKEANCKKCGFPTCMAYAMKLAKGDAESSKCEYISAELKSMLEDASQKQQEEVAFGPESNKVKIGDEIVMFRHDKTFINPTCISVLLESSDADFDLKLEKIKTYSIERVGESFGINAISLNDNSDDFAQKAKKLSNLSVPLILISDNFDKIKEALDVTKVSRPLVFLKNAQTDVLSQINKEYNVPVVVSASSVEELAQKSETLVSQNIKDIVLHLNKELDNSIIQDLTLIRRAAIEQKHKPLGFPVISFLKSKGDVIEDAIMSSVLLCKYSNVVVFDNFDSAILSGLYTLRQNVYTDPQKPLQVEAKLYEVGEVTKDSPIFVTTNFALTYFAVISEIEASGVPAYLLITPSDGMSVLTAWSASKFTGEIIAKALKAGNLPEMLNHRELIIPGFVSSLAEEIEDELPDWKVICGPNEAVEIVDFIKLRG